MESLVTLRRNAGMSQQALAKELSIAQNTLSQYERGTRSPDHNTLQRIADFFHVSVDFLLGRTVPADIYHNLAPSTDGSKWVPVLGDVAAGIPIEAIEDIVDYEEISSSVSRSGDYFALRIKGDSMEPRMTNGDVVIVRKQDFADEGDIAVVLVNGDSATVKKVSFQNGGLILIPFNQAYSPVYYSRDDVINRPVNIIGKVVELRAKY